MAPKTERQAWAIRFPAYGKLRYVSLGTTAEGWSREKAADELENVLADVRRGTWSPHEPVEAKAPVGTDSPTFHEFASEWLASMKSRIRPSTYNGYRTEIVRHLLPYFADFRLHEITVQEVDRYRDAKVAERDRLQAAIEAGRPELNEKGHKRRPLSNNSINETLKRLSSILEVAVEYGLIVSNPAQGKRRRLRREKPHRPHVEPEQLVALLDAAEELTVIQERNTRGTKKRPPERKGQVTDRASEYRRIARPLLAILAGAGLRIGEAVELRWRDVQIGSRTLTVRASKTDAGVREVELTPALAEELGQLSASAEHTGRDDFVLTTGESSTKDKSSKVAQLDRHRARERILKPAVRLANERLEAQGIAPIEDPKFHGLRRTYISIRSAMGDNPVWIASQVGHEDPTFTLSVYAKAAKRRDRLTGAHAKAFDAAIEWAEMGRNARRDLVTPQHEVPADNAKAA